MDRHHHFFGRRSTTSRSVGSRGWGGGLSNRWRFFEGGLGRTGRKAWTKDQRAAHGFELGGLRRVHHLEILIVTAAADAAATVAVVVVAAIVIVVGLVVVIVLKIADAATATAAVVIVVVIVVVVFFPFAAGQGGRKPV